MPAPLAPSTPILAPVEERQVDAAQDLPLGRDDLAQVLHRECVFASHRARYCTMARRERHRHLGLLPRIGLLPAAGRPAGGGGRGRAVLARQARRAAAGRGLPLLPAGRWASASATSTAVAYYESPVKKLGRQLWAGAGHDAPGLAWLDPRRAERAIREVLGFEGRIDTFDHHASHAASAFFFSGFPEAAVLTVDGVGEWATTTYGGAQDADRRAVRGGRLPRTRSGSSTRRSPPISASGSTPASTRSWASPRTASRACSTAMRKLVRVGPGGGSSRSTSQYFDFVRGPRMYSDALAELSARRRGWPERR